MGDISFEREVRTPHSEAFVVFEDDRQVGRVDIHFAEDVVHLSLAVDESLTQDGIQELIDTVDEMLLDAVGINREGLIVHVFQGRELEIYTDDDYTSNGREN